MYTKILIPTDGSALSLAAAVKGVEFAQQIGASVVGFYAPQEYQYPVYYDGMTPFYDYPSEAEYKKSARAAAEKYLNYIRDAAHAAKVDFTPLTQFSNAPADAIMKTAKSKHCDLIFMGSHGRSGLSRLFLGSVANKVVVGCTIPVLVHRTAKRELAQAEKYLKQAQKAPHKIKIAHARRLAVAIPEGVRAAA
jgi:nucleotide-binding universal stress UspA family protein